MRRFLFCSITDLRRKEVINIKNGMRIGLVGDVEIDLCNAKIVSIIIYGRLKLFGLLGRYDDIVIKWEDVSVVGEDTILVNFCQITEGKHRNCLSKIFNIKNK